MVQFLLDERDSLLESLDAEEVAAMAVIEDNLKMVEMNVKAVDKAIADINKHMSGKTSFEVSLCLTPLKSIRSRLILLGYKHCVTRCQSTVGIELVPDIFTTP